MSLAKTRKKKRDSHRNIKAVVGGKGAIEFLIVGIGASAGGLDAFKKFFDAMPSESGMAFILIQHLDPLHASITAELLASHTVMSVVQIEDPMAVEADHVYVIPPNRDLTIQDGVLHLIEPIQPHGMRLPIDFFFRSLAEDRQEKALCAILSGTGTDGTLGLKAIKGNGGMAMAQSPETAQFDGMPRSAIETGMVDYIVPVEEMPEVLIKYVRHAGELMGSSAAESTALEQLSLIIAALRSHGKYDFHRYKKGTLMRRIERRMGLNYIEDLADYARMVQDDEQEAARLFRDLLISVTSFYREPEAYRLLDKEVIQKVVREKEDDEPIRVWVPGCATGEEAYSIGILFLEQLEAMRKHCPIQIFASDIDEQALAVARTGLYPVNIAADVSAERLRQFFHKRDQYYQVGKPLRDCVVFAEQNLISDPPFSKLDLISCRNLLIYLEPEIQRKIISLFHFVLNDGGALFLGSSETIGQQQGLFHPVSKKFRLYQRTGSTRRDRLDLPFMSGLDKFPRAEYGAQAKFAEPANLAKMTQQLLLTHYAPFAVLINRKYEILYLYGQSGPYLELTTGEPTQDLMVMVREGLRSKLRGAVQKAIKNERETMIAARVRRDGLYCPVRLTALPLKVPKLAEGLVVVTFAEATEPAPMKTMPGMEAEVTNEALVNQLESELSETKDDLRSSVEEMEAANEELKTSNEEVLSMNEELQSTNEELETSKEELQSLNEELTTVNNQLQDKVEELAATNDDLANLLSSTDIAVLFLDSQFRIKRFTPATCNLFNLIFSDVGRPVGDISHRICDLNLQQDAETVLANLTPVEKQVRTDTEECYTLRLLPFRTEENKIEGVVATFVDITRLKQSEASLTRSKERVELLLKSTGEAIFGVDEKGLCVFVNNKFTEQLGFTADELLGNNIHELIHHTRLDGSHYPWVECFIYRCLRDGTSHQGGHDIAWRKDGTSFPTLYCVEPIVERGGVTGAVVIFRDVTEEMAVSSKLDHLARHDSLTGLVNRREIEERLARVLENTKHNQSKHILCYLDLDQFKVINDTCGHLAGDELLRQITGVLSQHVRKRDTLARLGGDEFGVLMEHCDPHEGERVANGMRDAVADYRFLWEGKAYTVGVSIGVVSIIDGDGDITDVLKAADAACYAAKESGRNRIHVYNEQDTALATRHGEMQWVARINRALEEDRLHLTLQPIVPVRSVEDGNISYEALLRMQDDSGNIILPTDFLGAAERYNLSTRLDRWVISRIFSWYASNSNKLAHVSLLNINLSGQSLADEEFLSFSIAEFKKYRVPREKICFEITETAAITNLASANRFMHALKQLGCLFALDDFGTGLSSFGYLKTLPVEYLKISGIFVKDIVDNPIDMAMVKSINEIAQVMGKKTIAESVESEEILVKLSELGINYAQGYLTGKPRRLDDVKFPGKQGQPK